MNILAIGAHPDDIEVGCGGTLGRYSLDGCSITMCTVAKGDKGHTEIEPNSLQVIRKEEATEAAAMISAEYVSLNAGDVEISAEDKALKDDLVEIIRSVQPDVLITHPPEDYMPDHVAVSKLVFSASFAATVPNYAHSKGKTTAKITPLYYMDTLAGVDFIPEEYVDISETLETKIQMLEKHQTQLKWMKDHDGIDFTEFVTTVARFRGLQCGAVYAEAFRQCRVWPKVKTKRFLP